MFGNLLFGKRGTLIRLSGLIVIVFGLSFMGVLKLGILSRSAAWRMNTQNLGFWSSVVFGGAFSLGWTPCMTAFLGTALVLASHTQTAVAGMALLFVFGMGLGLPFILTALLWQQLQRVLGAIRNNLELIQKAAGALLVLTGLLMVTGHFQRYMGLFN